jgi:cell division protein ZapA (FtsZ GTPase activity inhibitor)
VEKIYNITLQGRMIQISSEENEESLNRLIDFVNSKINELSGISGVDPHDIALLAALNIADEYFREQEKINALKKKISSKSALLLKMLSDGELPEYPVAGNNPS